MWPGLGGGGADLRDRKRPAAFPHCKPPGAHTRDFLGGIGIHEQKAAAGSEDGLLWKSGAGGDLDGLSLVVCQTPEHQAEGQLPSFNPALSSVS